MARFELGILVSCVTCGSGKVKSEDFDDDLSRKEFTISGMCQNCQDGVFGSAKSHSTEPNRK